jgi:hypothetical protein
LSPAQKHGRSLHLFFFFTGLIAFI